MLIVGAGQVALHQDRHISAIGTEISPAGNHLTQPALNESEPPHCEIYSYIT
jgi:hypothetical protein